MPLTKRDAAWNKEVSREVKPILKAKKWLVGSSDQGNTLWDTVELEGDCDGTYWGVRACLRPRKRTCGSDGNRGSRLARSAGHSASTPDRFMVWCHRMEGSFPQAAGGRAGR